MIGYLDEVIRPLLLLLRKMNLLRHLKIKNEGKNKNKKLMSSGIDKNKHSWKNVKLSGLRLKTCKILN